MSHSNKDTLLHQLKVAKSSVEVGGRYFHYKHPDKFYTILRIGFIEKTEEVCVIYEAEFEDELVWVRTLTDFLSKVKLEDVEEIDRFTKVE